MKKECTYGFLGDCSCPIHFSQFTRENDEQRSYRYISDDNPDEEQYKILPIEIKKTGCPCTLVEACMRSCTCAHPMLSGGCRRCALYGSLEQQINAAKRLVKNEKELQKLKDQNLIDDYKDTKKIN